MASPTQAALRGFRSADAQAESRKNLCDADTGFLGVFYIRLASHQTAVRQGDWKYHSREIFRVKSTTRKYNGPTLYNLKDDIGESNNLIDLYPEIAERLAKVLETNPNKRVAMNKK